jgi:hypothetical protein
MSQIPAGLSDYQRQYQINPILFENGIASGTANGNNGQTAYQPISEFTQLNGTPDDLDEYFCHFKPLSGSTLQNWQVANYPFANSTIAANATIAQPLNISLVMVCPARNANTLAGRQSILTTLKQLLDVHILQGGTFTVLTPAYVYQNCLLTALRDITSQDDKQVQSVYQWDFVQPLLTQEAAEITYNGLMNKLNNFYQVSGLASNSDLQSTIPVVVTQNAAQTVVV